LLILASPGFDAPKFIPMPMSKVQAPLALVTGAANGIGKATTRRLLDEGMRVIALDRSAEVLAELQRELGGCERLIHAPCDLSLPRRLPELLSELTERHGPVTRLVNNAATWPSGSLLDLDDEAWDLTMAVNLTAPFVLIRGLAPLMAEAGGGAIVNVASRNAFRSSTKMAAYDASKAALIALTRTAAGELAKQNIRVNAVCPGMIDTAANADLDKLFVAAYRKLIPMDRLGNPTEIASVIAFLLSVDSSFVTGQSIVIDGGQIACQDNERFMEIPGMRP
jgi:NAD(P)-dependent dehydrogenase (short-subunit alcohol dehydrogenase family)